MKFYSVLVIIVFSMAINIFSQVQFIPDTITTSANGANSVYAIDLDGDGDIDVLSASVLDDKIAWYENDGNENFTSHTITTSANGASSVYAIDVDGDGDIDVLSASQNDNKIAWYENDGNENFTPHTITTGSISPSSVYALDIDGDSDVDVLSSAFYDNIAWYENDGNENFTTHIITTIGSIGVANSAYPIDVDGDGDIDVLGAGHFDNIIIWYENDGDENFSPDTITTNANFPMSVYAEDLDGDGDMDVMSASLFDSKIAWYENDGNENFITHIITTNAIGAISVYASDLDGDGDIDVLSASQNDNKIAWYENDGNENFTTHIITTDLDGARKVYAIDLDNDDDMDVLSASWFDAKITWYETLRFFQLTVTVADGWNMVSVPGTNPAGMGVTDWWSGKDPAADVFKYSGGYLPITTTAPTEGYWMKNVGAQVYNYAAIEIVTHTDISAAAGWNMIGGYENTVPVGALVTTPPGLITTTIFEYSAGYVAATDIVAGYGYWVKMDAAGLIGGLGAPPPLAKSSVEVVEYFQEDWGRIIITDNAGVSYTLYAVTGEVDLDKYELPPSPPAGMFDIRYSSGRIAEDINSSIQKIEMSSLEYPVSVTVENISISLQDERGRKVNSEIIPGQEVVINDTSVKKLRIHSEGTMKPTEYSLEQNYPNPFNPTTKIRYSVPQSSKVVIKVFDILGNEIETLVNKEKQTGTYEITWYAEQLPSGVYFYQLRAGDFVETKKMMLMK